jgi:hypothetical protein
MSETKDELEVIPGTTQVLLPWLLSKYPATELSEFVRSGNLLAAQCHQAKIDLINELIELWGEQQKHANEVTVKRRRA